MIAHSSCRKRLRTNRKGYSAIIATIIMVLVILYFYFNVMMFSLNRDEDLQDVVSRTAQLDADRNAEKVTITDIAVAAQGGQLTVTCTLVNTGAVPIQMARLWLEDKTLPQSSIGNVALMTSPVLLQPGARILHTFPPVTIQGSSASDQFYLWLVTFRGNSFSQIAG